MERVDVEVDDLVCRLELAALRADVLAVHAAAHRLRERDDGDVPTFLGAVDGDLDTRQGRRQRDREGGHLLILVRSGADVVRIAPVRNARRVVAAFFRRLLWCEAADVAEARDLLRRRAVVDVGVALRFADVELLVGGDLAHLLVPDRLTDVGHVQATEIVAVGVECRPGQLVTVVRGIDVADHRFERLRATRIARVRVGPLGDDRQIAELTFLALARRDGKVGAGIEAAAEIAQGFVHHLADGVAPHLTLTG